MRQKLITLCPTSYEIAQKKPNFSSWVRKKLLEGQSKSESEITKTRSRRCPHGWSWHICSMCPDDGGWIDVK